MCLLLLEEGKLVPVEITVRLLEQAMQKLGWSQVL